MMMNEAQMAYMMSPVNDSSMYLDTDKMKPDMPYGGNGWTPAGFDGNPDTDYLGGAQSSGPDPVRFAHEIETLSTIFGPDVVAEVTQQLLTEKLSAGAEDLVADMGMPPIAQDAACECLRGNATQGANTSGDVGQAIESVIGDDLDQVVEMVLDSMRDEMNDEMKRALNGPGTGSQGGNSLSPDGGAANATGGEGTTTGTTDGATDGHENHSHAEQSPEGGSPESSTSEASTRAREGSETNGTESSEGAEKASETEETSETEKTGGPEETGGSSSGGGTSADATGNWLVILASVLGKKSGEHLKAMVSLGSQMGELDSKAEPEKFAQFQSEFQAETQIFKMFQEAISTMIKSIGEGMSSVARKS